MSHHRFSTYLLLLFHLYNARHCHVSPSSRHTLVSRWKPRHASATFVFKEVHSRRREGVPAKCSTYDPGHRHIRRWTFKRYRTHDPLKIPRRLVTSYTHLYIPELYLPIFAYFTSWLTLRNANSRLKTNQIAGHRKGNFTCLSSVTSS